MTPEHQAEWDALTAEHAELQRAHTDLEGRPHDRAAVVAHLQRLHDHTAHLHNFTTRLQHELTRKG